MQYDTPTMYIHEKRDEEHGEHEKGTVSEVSDSPGSQK